MFRSFFASWKWAPFAYGGLILLFYLQYEQVQVALMCLQWNTSYGDMMQGGGKYTAEQWFDHLMSYRFIAYYFIIYEVASIFSWRVYSLLWRTCAMKWMLPYWLKTRIDVEETPQRLTDGIAEATRTITGFSTQFFRMGSALLAFLPKLWEMSASVDFSFIKKIQGAPNWVISVVLSLDGIPGILVWITIVVGLVCLFVALLIGIYLPKLESANQNNEGALRKSTERIQRSKDREGDPMAELCGLIETLRTGYSKTILNQFLSDTWRCVYNQGMVVFPMFLFGGGVVSGAIKFGVLTGSAVAFGEVNGVFITIQNNWLAYTRFWSVMKRIFELEKNIKERPLDREADEKGRWPIRDRRM